MFAPALAAQYANAHAANPVVKTFISSSAVVALIAKAINERKEKQSNLSQCLLQLAPYNANLECRASLGPAAVHEMEAELFYVIDGSATMVNGGTLVNEKRRNERNLSGTEITGGVSRKITKGDFIMVPENTPHWVSAIDETLVLMSLHLQGSVAAVR